MLDVRVYRTAFLPALVALFVAAFALEDRPDPAREPLPADAFTASRAMEQLDRLAAAYPDRAAGSTGDARLADFVARSLAAPAEARKRPGFDVKRTVSGGLETVVGTRLGLSSRRIVVLSQRDSRNRPGRAELSATAAMLELGRVFKTRELRKTLVLVSTSGATTGFQGAREWARREAGGPVDGVIVLGDMAAARPRKPWVVSWPGDAGPVPLALERTVQAAVRRETGSHPGGPRALGQWMRRALPLTLSAQGAVGDEGLPAVLVSASGERGPAPRERVLERRMGGFGRSVLRAVEAIDAAGREDGPAFRESPAGIVTMRNVLPDWAIRLLVGTALLPPLLVALDAFFRARRRRVSVAPGLRWLAAAALPLPVAWLWLRLLGATGVYDAPGGVVDPTAVPVTAGGIEAMASAALVAVAAGWLALRLARQRRDPERDAPRREAAAFGLLGGLPVAIGLLLCGLGAVTWALNPYAAALAIPAAHLWLFAAGGWRGRPAAAAIAAGLALPALLVLYYGLALRLGPGELAWGAVLAATAGANLGSALLAAGLLAALAGLVRVLAARRRLAPPGDGAGAIRTRGPLTYAGPGSLGGTESALRR